MKKILACLIFVICGSVFQAIAQMPLGRTPLQSTNPMDFALNQSYWNNYYLGNMRFNMAMVAAAQRNVRSKSKTNVKNQPNTPVDFTVFQPSARILPKSIAVNAKDNSGETEKLLNFMLDSYERTARKDYFPANDLAYAFNYFVVNNYMTAHDAFAYKNGTNLDRDPSWMDYSVKPNEETAVYKQFKQMLSANPEIKKMTARQKQELTEMLAIITRVNFTAYDKGLSDGDPDLIKQARESSKQVLEKLFGVTIDKISISTEGLTIK